MSVRGGAGSSPNLQQIFKCPKSIRFTHRYHGHVPSKRHDLDRRIAAHGLGAYAAILRRHSRECLYFSTPGARTRVAVGSSFFGGWPDLPDPALWPHEGERPMSFIGQLALSDLPRPTGAIWPKGGMLWFFMGVDEPRTGFEGAVIYRDGRRIKSLQRTRLDPEAFGEGAQLVSPHPLRPKLGVRIPSVARLQVLESLTDEDVETLYDPMEDLDMDLRPKGEVAQLGGWVHDVDDDPETFAVLALRGKLYDYGWRAKPRNARLVAREASRWQPLFRLRSVIPLGFQFWDAYSLCYLVRDEEPLATRFDAPHVMHVRGV